MSAQAELEVLSSAMLYEHVADEVSKLKASHFKHYGVAFGKFLDLYGSGISPTETNFVSQFGFERYWEYAYLNVSEQLEYLKQQYKRGKLMDVLSKMSHVLGNEHDFDSFILDYTTQIADIIQDSDEVSERHISGVMDESLRLIELLKQGDMMGKPTGLDVDHTTGGIQAGQFTIIAARPSHGKTALALQIAEKFAHDETVAFLSLETTASNLGLRLLSSVSGIDGDVVRNGRLSEEDDRNILYYADKLSKRGLIIDDGRDLSAESFRSKVNYLVRKYGIKTIFVDYVQLMQSQKDNREQQISEISRMCSRVAGEFDLRVIGIAQLSRSVEARSDKRPILSDLRESGQLEQDAYLVKFLYRPAYYGITEYENGESTDNICEIIVAKNKDGRTGHKKQHFHAPTMRFSNLKPKGLPI